MKTFRKLGYFGLLPIFGLGLVALMAAGITGEFTQVTSVNGYQVNGAAGSSGQALCSNGTYFATPCTLGGGTITGVTANSPLTGGGSSGSVSLGMADSGVTAGSYTNSDVTIDQYGRVTAASNGTGSAFTGTSGYQTLPSGLIFEWGETSNFDTGPSTITFPLQFPHACLMPPQLTDNVDVSTAARIWLSGSCTTTGATVRNDGLGQAHYLVIGY